MSEHTAQDLKAYKRGYFAIGVEHSKTHYNIGTLWRTANLLDAAFLFTVGRRYTQQCTDTMSTPRHIPLFNFATLDDLWIHIPYDCMVIGVELDARSVPLHCFSHPPRAIYLLGAEDHGLTKEALTRCHHIVQLPGRASMNVAVAGSIVLYDRWQKRVRQEAVERVAA